AFDTSSSRRLTTLIMMLVLSACSLLPQPDNPPTSVAVAIPTRIPPVTISPIPTNTPQDADIHYPDGLMDMLPILSGICFEAAWDAAGQVFILRDAEAHIRFY